jgi:thioredoxin-dependent peroxiredoxin
MPHNPIPSSSFSRRLRRVVLAALTSLAIAPLTLVGAESPSPPKADDAAPNFVVRTLDDKPVELQQLTAKSPVVLVVLRGWPGYQCPLCTRQVQDYIANAGQFRERKAQVLMVYPGPADQLKEHAREFLANKDWPPEFIFALDPDYALIKAYGLRWDATKETAYPSTFIIDQRGRVRFAYVSKSHGDRVSAARALGELK